MFGQKLLSLSVLVLFKFEVIANKIYSKYVMTLSLYIFNIERNGMTKGVSF